MSIPSSAQTPQPFSRQGISIEILDTKKCPNKSVSWKITNISPYLLKYEFVQTDNNGKGKYKWIKIKPGQSKVHVVKTKTTWTPVVIQMKYLNNPYLPYEVDQNHWWIYTTAKPETCKALAGEK